MKVFMRKALINNGLFRLLTPILALISQATVAHAQVEEDPLDRLFTIQAITLDETASRASEARRTALAKAELEAYEKLMRKLTQPEGRAKLPPLEAREIQAMISGIEVVSEQSSSRRYLATLNVRFEPGLVSQFLASHNVPHVLGTGRGILVLHAHKRALETLLWEPDQTLQAARQEVDWLNRIRQYVFARGEMAERALLTFEEVQNLQSRDAGTLARRYGVRSSLMISSAWTMADGQNQLRYRFFSTDGDIAGENTIRDTASEQSALVTMYDAVLDQIDSAWRAQLLVDTGVGDNLRVRIPTTDLATFNTVMERLGDVSLVSGVKTEEIGLPFSVISFDYTGREDQLILALRYAGLVLQDYGDDKMLSPRDDQDPVG